MLHRIVKKTFRFKQAARTSRGCYLERNVFYVVFTDPLRKGAIGIGECAPLPDLSCDVCTDYAERLDRFCRLTAERGAISYDELRPYPSMLFGIETAWLSLRASVERGDFRLLFDGDFSRSRAGIVTNGLIWMGTYEEMAARIEAKLQDGFTCVKLKIGAIDFDAELDLLRRIRQRFSPDDVCLRVDANGAFQPADALERLERLAAYHLHSIEQPIRAGQWDEMARLCRQTPVPIALDEELIGVNDAAAKQSLLDTVRPQFLVLKPSLHGGLHGSEEWMDLAQQRGIPFWTTSALETNVGLNCLASWCATLRPTLPQGLGTGALFVRNFDRIPLEMRGERLWCGTQRQTDFALDVQRFLADWKDERVETMTFHTSGSTGTPRALTVEKERIRHSIQATRAALFPDEPLAGRTALLCLPVQYVAGAMMAARCTDYGMTLLLSAPSSTPYADLQAAPFFAALTPMQALRTLETPRGRRLLRATPYVLLGGGAIPESLAREVATWRNVVVSTYAMTETLSHVALRRLSAGPQGLPPETSYTPLPGVRIWTNADGCLCISAPKICPADLTTNDLGEVYADGTFRIFGRRDRTICSGGLKFQAEALEALLEPLHLREVLIHAEPDALLGQHVALQYVGEASEDAVLDFCRQAFPRHAVPRAVRRVAALGKTATGKIKITPQ